MWSIVCHRENRSSTCWVTLYVPRIAIEVVIGEAVEVVEAAAFDLLPPLGDRAEVGEVASRRERSMHAVCTRVLS